MKGKRKSDASEATPTETVVRSMTYSADDPAPLVLTTIAKILLIVCAFVFLLGLSLIAVSAVGIVQGW
uniref:Uncharacterized protein n=1 Tax=Ditylenchus dipsaci TaxID=166011 RepID=A0A915EM81_9BILA